MDLKLHRTIVTFHSDNISSQKMIDRLGMRQDDHFKEAIFRKNKWIDAYVYAILKRGFFCLLIQPSLQPTDSNTNEDQMKKLSLVLSFVLSLVFLLSGYACAENRSADGRYLDLGNGVIKDTKTNLMWTQKDSYVNLGKSLNWNESNDYVKELSSGGYSDWRLPTIAELKTIYEPSKFNKDIFGGRVKLDPIFAKKGPYSYWSSETDGSCCARAITFDYGFVSKHHRNFSGSYGVRAVRR